MHWRYVEMGVTVLILWDGTLECGRSDGKRSTQMTHIIIWMIRKGIILSEKSQYRKII